MSHVVMALEDLFKKYQLTPAQINAFNTIKTTKNMPDFFKTLPNEELIWCVCVATFDMRKDEQKAKLTPNDIKFYNNKVEERVRKLEEAEKRFGWFSKNWTKPLMKRLITHWFCEMFVIDPNPKLRTKDGNILQWMHEYYGPGSNYPDKNNQTDNWKQEVMEHYVLLSRTICKVYPEATFKGIVSFSDMKDFNWDLYDMETKSRNADIGSMIPNKLTKMITIRPDEKMKNFYKEMTPRLRKKYGFVQYESFQEAMGHEHDEKGYLPGEDFIPTFVGGTYKVDLIGTLRYLFSKEPEALKLMEETYLEMKENGEIPRPDYME